VLTGAIYEVQIKTDS